MSPKLAGAVFAFVHMPKCLQMESKDLVARTVLQLLYQNVNLLEMQHDDLRYLSFLFRDPDSCNAMFFFLSCKYVYIVKSNMLVNKKL